MAFQQTNNLAFVGIEFAGFFVPLRGMIRLVLNPMGNGAFVQIERAGDLGRLPFLQVLEG